MYDLYKLPIQLETLNIVQYLYSLGIDTRPCKIIERNHHSNACVLPTIHDHLTNKWYIGLPECIRYYESKSGINELYSKAIEFKKTLPVYRITDIVNNNGKQSSSSI